MITATVTPGYTYTVGEVQTEAKENAAANPAVDIEGAVGTATIADGSITSSKFAAGAVNAAALGALAVTASAIDPGAVNATNTPPDAFFFGAATVTGSTAPFAIAFAANGVQTPTPSNYVQGQFYCFLPNFNCPGNCTLNINTIGVAPLYKNVSQPLGAGDFLSGQLVWVQFDGTNFQLTTPPNVAGGGNAGVLAFPTPAQTTQASFTASQLILSNAAAGTFRFTSVSVLGIDLTVSGAGGLDTGSVAASTWYYLYAIWNGTTLTGLLSLSPTAPTLPAGYLAMALIGPVLTDASSQVAPYYQMGRKVFIQISLLFQSQSPTTNKTYQSLASTTLSTAAKTALGLSGTVAASTVFAGYVPPIATMASGWMGTNDTSATGIKIAVAGDANGTGEAKAFVGSDGTSTSWTTGTVGSRYYNVSYCDAPFTVPLITSQEFYWAAGSSSSLYMMAISGYEF